VVFSCRCSCSHLFKHSRCQESIPSLDGEYPSFDRGCIAEWLWHGFAHGALDGWVDVACRFVVFFKNSISRDALVQASDYDIAAAAPILGIFFDFSFGYARSIAEIFTPLLCTVAVILLRHSASGFAFDQVHKVLHPFQRNHVSYAATLALFIPFVWYLMGTLRRYSFQWWGMAGVFLILLTATYLTYTRAAYLSLLIAAGSYFVFRFRLIRYALLLGVAGAIVLVSYLAVDERYLDYAPNYDTTIMHTEFGSLLEATTKGEDISTMERVHRWVAAVRMSQKSPWLGYGPGNFVHFYEPYTVNSFKTYVSRNEERSGVHSYFLLLLVEQGWPGLVFFLGLSFWVFIRGETIYQVYRKERVGRLPMAILLVLVVVYSFLIINDMIETDKVGSYFFLCLAMLVRLDFAGWPALLEEPDSYEQEK